MKLVTCVCRDWNTHCIEVYELKLNFVYCSAEMNFMNFAMCPTDMGNAIFPLFSFVLSVYLCIWHGAIIYPLSCFVSRIQCQTEPALPISENIRQIVFVYVSFNGWLCNVVAIHNYCFSFIIVSSQHFHTTVAILFF